MVEVSPTVDDGLGAVVVVDGSGADVDDCEMGARATVVDVDRAVVEAVNVDVDAWAATVVLVVRTVVVVLARGVVGVTTGANRTVWVGTGAGRTRM